MFTSNVLCKVNDFCKMCLKYPLIFIYGEKYSTYVVTFLKTTSWVKG